MSFLSSAAQRHLLHSVSREVGNLRRENSNKTERQSQCSVLNIVESSFDEQAYLKQGADQTENSVKPLAINGSVRYTSSVLPTCQRDAEIPAD